MGFREPGARSAALAALATGAAALVFCLSPVSAEEGPVAGGPRAYATPEALIEATIAAAAANDDAALRALTGAEHAHLIQAGADSSVAHTRAEFVENTREFWALRDNEDGTKTLVVGDGRWPFPVPLVRGAGGWAFDMEAGVEVMRLRRIGRNELEAIRLARAYAAAQEEYRAKDRDGDGVREYAQRLRSTPGTRDGLYWPTGDDGEESPFGPLVASLRPHLEGYEKGDPVGGYHWKILTGQGPRAPGGHHSYVINGNMIAGFALLGVPARYGETGVMTFLVSHHGDVLERDLGVCTEPAGRITELYNPDQNWRRVED